MSWDDIKSNEMVDKLKNGFHEKNKANKEQKYGERMKAKAHAAIMASAFRTLIYTIFVCVLLFGVFRCSQVVKTEIVMQQATIDERNASGGALPGLELRSDQGGLYDIVTFPERPGLECLRTLKQLACYYHINN